MPCESFARLRTTYIKLVDGLIVIACQPKWKAYCLERVSPKLYEYIIFALGPLNNYLLHIIFILVNDNVPFIIRLNFRDVAMLSFQIQPSIIL